MHQKPKNYRDYVIKDGKLIGEWEQLYSDVEDPWGQTKFSDTLDSVRATIVNICKRLGLQHKVVEIGCGFGYLTDAINNIGMPCLGIDASPTAIQKAKNLFPASEFVCANADDFDLFKKFDAQIFIFAEIT